ncbi:MAG: carboxylating nicotinate-nucleotide diphosphorylase [Candidatus Methanomethylophilaceae archaeon]|jgi:nicotinate-nucleotide pyrophosphorylase (carboxylating)
MDHIQQYLDEDIRSGDITTKMFVPDIDGKAIITCEEDAIVAGLEEAVDVFSRMNVVAEMLIKDGTQIKAGTVVMKMVGPLRGITTCERVALNIMMRMSGIATTTNDATQICRAKNSKVMIAGTRKTTPGFRKFEKKAIALGGGDPHRYGLDDLILIKDNHIKAVGGIAEAMEIAMEAPFSMKVEIEVENIRDAEIAAKCGADIIMIDNQPPKITTEIYDLIKSINKNIKVEASGKITLNNVADYANSADIISMGCLTHSVKAIHFSLDIQ